MDRPRLHRADYGYDAQGVETDTMIDFVAHAPASIEAAAGITEHVWYRAAAASGTGGVGTVFGASDADPDLVRATRTRAKYSEGLRQQLQSLLRMELGWDSYGAQAVSPRAVETALAFLSRLLALPQPSIVPTPAGGIQLEWHDGRVDIEIECSPEGHAQLSAEDVASGESVERWVVPGHTAIDAWLGKLRVRS